MLEMISSQSLTALFQVVMIDLVLAGDNAIVIGLAAAGLPEDKRKKATLGNVAYAFGQVAKEGHLARGEATSNIQYYQLNESEKEIDAELEKIESELSSN